MSCVLRADAVRRRNAGRDSLLGGTNVRQGLTRDRRPHGPDRRRTVIGRLQRTAARRDLRGGQAARRVFVDGGE